MNILSTIRTILAGGILLLASAHAADLQYVYTSDSNTMIVFMSKGDVHGRVCARVAETPYDPDLVETTVIGSGVYTIC